MLSIYAAILLLVGCASGDIEDLRRIDSLRQEESCLREGGMCVIAADCPLGQLSARKNLCPLQRSQGVECCHGISVKETRCRKFGGECRSDFCNPNLIARQANDCGAGTQCCILV